MKPTHNENGPAGIGVPAGPERPKEGHTMRRRSIIPHMTTEQLTMLRDGLYDAQRHAMRMWGIQLTPDQVAEIALCLTQWQDGRTTIDQLRGQVESETFALLVHEGVNRPMPVCWSTTPQEAA